MMVISTEWCQLEIIDLNDDGTGLGFSISGGKSTGVVIRTITPGGAANLDGRLQIGDHLVHINDIIVRGMGAEQVAVVLRHYVGMSVRMVVVRCIAELLPEHQYNTQAPVIATAHLDAHLQRIIAVIMALEIADSDTDSRRTSTVGCIKTPTVSLYDVNATPDVINQLKPKGRRVSSTSIKLNVRDCTIISDCQQNRLSVAEVTSDDDALVNKWNKMIGNEFTILVAHLEKFRERGGLGISLEGTVDVEDGVEVRPRHYISDIQTNGPVGVNGLLRNGDELLEANGEQLWGKSHVQVVKVLKELSKNVCLVCARANEVTPNLRPTISVTSLPNNVDRLIKAKSEQALSLIFNDNRSIQARKNRSYSLEPMQDLAVWDEQVDIIQLKKAEHGLGFCIQEYRNSRFPDTTAIVIKSLVPGGIAQKSGLIHPGDRLVSVNDESLDNASLEDAVRALKFAPTGYVRIGILRLTPLVQMEETIHEENAITMTQSYECK